MEYFKREHMYLMTFEEFLSDAAVEMENLFAVLGIDTSFCKYIPEVKNAYRGYLSQRRRFYQERVLVKVVLH